MEECSVRKYRWIWEVGVFGIGGGSGAVRMCARDADRPKSVHGEIGQRAEYDPGYFQSTFQQRRKSKCDTPLARD